MKTTEKTGCRGRSSVNLGHLFFYLTAVAITVIIGLISLVGCDDKNEEQTQIPTDKTSIQVILEPNNGERETTWEVGKDLPQEIKRDGYELEYWCIDEECKVRIDLDDIEEIIKLSGQTELKLYAKWKEIEKEIEGVRMVDAFLIYDGYTHALELEGVPEGATVEYEGAHEFTDAGKYVVTAVIKKTGYKQKRISGTLEISKATADLSGIVFEDTTIVWNGSKHSIEIAGELPHGITVRYENNGQSEVGEYKIKAYFDGGSNYNEIAPKTATLTITARKYSIKFIEECGIETTKEVVHGSNLEDIPSPKDKTGYSVSWDTDSFDNITSDMEVHAIYEPIRYGIEYHLNGGETEEEPKSEYTVLDAFTLPCVSRAHYNFCGWFDNAAFNGETVDKLHLGETGAKEFYAKWEQIKYEIRYELRGGINSAANTTEGRSEYIYGIEDDELILAAALKRGYRFIKWVDKDKNEVLKICAATIGSYTLYAEWELIEYRIEYDLKGGIMGAGSKESYTIEDAKIELVEPVKAGYIFCGWYGDEACDTEEIKQIETTMARDIKLFAKWEARKYQIIYETFGGINDVSNPESYTVEYGELELRAAACANREFLGWYANADYEGERITALSALTDGSITLYAKWRDTEYFIDYELRGGIGNASEIRSYTVGEGTIELLSPTKAGYSFCGWYEDEDCTGESISSISRSEGRNIRLYAKWEAIEYQIVYKLDGGVNGAGNPDTYTAADGEIELEAATKNGYGFDGWFKENTDEQVTVLSALTDGKVTLIARWSAVEYRITYNLNGGTNNINNPAKYTVNDGEIELHEPTKANYQFVGWYKDSKFESEMITSLSALRDGGITLYAKWSPTVYTITYNLSGGINSTDNPIRYTVEDDEIELKEASRAEHIFDGWYTNPDFEGEAITSIATTDGGNIVLYAKWKDKQENPENPDENGDDDNKGDDKPTSPFTVKDGIITGYDYTKGKDIIIAKEIGGAKITGIAKGVLAQATRVEIQAEIEELSGDEFEGCAELKELILPSTLTSMPTGLLRDCVKLENLTVPYASNKRFDNELYKTYLPLGVLFGQTASDELYEVSVYKTEVMDTGIEVSTDADLLPKRYVPKSLKYVTILDGEIIGRAMQGFESVLEIEVKESGTIQAFAFSGCTALTELRLSRNGGVHAENSALNKCTAIERILVASEDLEEISALRNFKNKTFAYSDN